MRRASCSGGLRVAPLLCALLAATSCGEVRDVELVLHPVSDAQDFLAASDPVRAVLASGDLDCAWSTAPALAALCVQVYTLLGGTIAMTATCHDAPGLKSDSDLAAFLRGLGPIASGISTSPDVRVYVRLLGYSSASRSEDSLVMCGVTPSVPGHVDESVSPPSLAVYVLCHDPASAPSTAGTVFGDYCGSSDFVAIFP